MRKCIVVATLTVALGLMLASVASAHHVDAVASTATCTGVTVQFSGFKPSDGPVNWIVTVDGQPNTAGAFNAFSGNKTFTQAYSPGPLTGPGSHTVVFRADWPTKGGNNGTFTKVVTGCPVAKPPVPPSPPKLPCPDQPPTAPCNCPPGPAGPAGPPGITTTVIVHEVEVRYVEKTCTSARVFHMTLAQRLPRDGRFRVEDRGQKIVAGILRYRTIVSKPGQPYEEGMKNGEKGVRAKKGADGRLRADADYRGVIAPKGQVRAPKWHVKLANGHWLWLTRQQRLCLGRDGDLNYPSDLSQDGHPGGKTGDEARAAQVKDPKYRKAVI